MENDIVRMLFLRRQRQKKRWKIKTISGAPPLTFKAKKAGTLDNYRIYGNTETKTRSYSGAAPLSFPIEDGAVSNYRIYGNTVNGESVGDLVTDSQSEHYGEYTIPITNNSETSNIYLDAPLRKVGDEAEYIDYGEQKQHRVRKNLLRNTVTRQTINGVTFTGSDGSITCNGTASDNILVNIIPSTFSLPEGAYILNGAPPGGGLKNNFKLDVRLSTNIYYPDIGNGIQFNLQTERITMCRIAIYSGYTCDNLTFYPMIRKADIEDDTYEPYIENTEVDVTLPALPAQSSTNSLSVGTEVQPSSVAVDVGEIESCGDKVTDSQSVNYGKYKIPVTLTADSAETTDIYLDTPLAKSGNSADYIDYATQKRHNSDGTESNVTLPAISTLAGTNTLTVGTEVQPSGVEITGRIKKGE